MHVKCLGLLVAVRADAPGLDNAGGRWGMLGPGCAISLRLRSTKWLYNTVRTQRSIDHGNYLVVKN